MFWGLVFLKVQTRKIFLLCFLVCFKFSSNLNTVVLHMKIITLLPLMFIKKPEKNVLLCVFFPFNYKWVMLLCAWMWCLQVNCNQSKFWQRINNNLLHSGILYSLFSISYHPCTMLIIWNSELKKNFWAKLFKLVGNGENCKHFQIL